MALHTQSGKWVQNICNIFFLFKVLICTLFTYFISYLTFMLNTYGLQNLLEEIAYTICECQMEDAFPISKCKIQM